VGGSAVDNEGGCGSGHRSGDGRPSGWRTDRPATEDPDPGRRSFPDDDPRLPDLEVRFKWVPGNACGQQADATLVEHWNYARGKAVVMEFSKIGPRAILLRRKGRPPGDAAFAAPGDLTRHATGYFDMGTFPGCGGWHSLIGPDCDQRYKVQSEMHLA